ncbi:hypothetical protein BH23GEM7_BH23GEM7_12870 [soil metagenome]
MKGNGRRQRRRLGLALLVSGAMHVGVVALLWAAAARGERLPPLKVYAVNIVSPPPTAAGEVAAPEPEPTPAEPTPAAPEPEPTPPAPQPEPARPAPQPRPDPPKETKPTPPRETRPTPTPARETPRPTPTPPRETRPAPARETPPARPRETQPAPAASKPAETPRTTEPTPRPAERATGPAPRATSAGGQDLNVRIEGAEFTDQAYLDNIYRQVQRHFRKPDESRTDLAEIRFWINRDGSVSEIAVVRSSGSFAFRVAAMEAIEQAGLNRAFGPLPRSYSADRLLVSFVFRPDR